MNWTAVWTETFCGKHDSISLGSFCKNDSSITTYSHSKEKKVWVTKVRVIERNLYKILN